MDFYNGEDLLKLFEKLNINLGHVHSNVVRGWFDIDDKDVQKVLNFICSSVSEENYISPRLQNEFNTLEKVLVGRELERTVDSLESQYPGIFECESNNFEIEILEDQVELLREQKQDCEAQFSFNEKLAQKLSVEHSKVANIESKTRQKFMESQRKCTELSSQLNEINNHLCEQLGNICSYVGFLNNLFHDGSEEQFRGVASQLAPVLKLDNSLDMSCNIKENILSDLKNRLLHSKMKSISYEMECEQLLAEKQFLDKCDPFSLPSVIDNSIIESKIEMKSKQLDSMLEVLENCTQNTMEELAGKCQIDYAKKELNSAKKKLESLDKIEEELVRLYCYHGLVLLLYSQENVNLKEFFQNMHSYNMNIRTCQMRNESMQRVLSDYEQYKELPFEKQSKLVSTLMNLFNNNCNSLNELLGSIHSRNEELKSLKYRHFLNFDLNFLRFKECFVSLKNMRKHLQSGPTCRLITLPLEIEEILINANLNMKNQDVMVKSAMNLSFKAKNKRRENEWSRYRSLLWAFFLTDVPKLLSVQEQLEQEVKSRNKAAQL